MYTYLVFFRFMNKAKRFRPPPFTMVLHTFYHLSKSADNQNSESSRSRFSGAGLPRGTCAIKYKGEFI